MAVVGQVAPDSNGDQTAAPLSLARRRTIAVVLFGVWTVFVWGGRIRNALGDPDLSSSQRTWSLVLAGTFLAVAVAALVVGIVAERRAGSLGVARTVLAVVALGAAWTTGVWVWRIVDIAGEGDHGIGFVLVHAVLAAVSVGLAWWASFASLAAVRDIR